jgi:long-chain acyl-CoA synthetase
MTLHPGTIAARDPDRLAVAIGDMTLSYAKLDADSRALAAQMFALGLRQGDVMAMLVGNRPEFFTLAWAAQRSGLYYVPIPTRLTSDEITYVLRDSGARVFAFDPDYEALAVRALDGLSIMTIGIAPDGTRHPEPPASEGSDMLYTSGSTGRPKAVKRPLSGAPLGSEARRVDRARALFGIDQESIFFSPAPLYHAAPLRFTMNVLRVGGTVIGARRFDAKAALATIARHRVTHSQWVPTMFVRMLALPPQERAAHDLSSHRVAIHSAAPCAPAIKRAMIAWWGPIVHECYAGTESIGFTHATSAEWLVRPGTVGRAVGSTIHILDDEGNACPPGTVGNVFFSGAAALSYHGDAAKTRAAHDATGRATIGDVGYVDADGYLFLTDRRAFTIISGGVNIYPAEVEAAFMELPAVADIAVFGVPDPEFGEAVFALVELAPGIAADRATALALADGVREHLASFKLPRRIAFGPVGRTETGKVHKAILRKRAADFVSFDARPERTEVAA